MLKHLFRELGNGIDAARDIRLKKENHRRKVVFKPFYRYAKTKTLIRYVIKIDKQKAFRKQLPVPLIGASIIV